MLNQMSQEAPMQPDPKKSNEYFIREAGKFAVIIAWLWLALLPLIMFMETLGTPKPTSSEVMIAWGIDVVFYGVIIAIFMIQGRKIKHLGLTNLAATHKALTVLMVTTAIAIAIGLLAGGRLALLLILFIVALNRGFSAVKREQTAATPPAATPPAAPAA
jgi:hypothetical protein